MSIEHRLMQWNLISSFVTLLTEQIGKISDDIRGNSELLEVRFFPLETALFANWTTFISISLVYSLVVFLYPFDELKVRMKKNEEKIEKCPFADLDAFGSLMNSFPLQFIQRHDGRTIHDGYSLPSPLSFFVRLISFSIRNVVYRAIDATRKVHKVSGSRRRLHRPSLLHCFISAQLLQRRMQLRRSTGIPFPVSIPSLIIHSREDYVGTRSSNGHEYELLRNITTHSNKGPVSQNNSAFPTHYYA
ncbi:hypothetical protein PRIPAC_76585, partial [Pristionchus pacificus]|uniref:Uncharacterized protein n=1 Tax=Pristionchus pacificus TaxID=54126 RepID=A0A2A6CRU4_PRIPA